MSFVDRLGTAATAKRERVGAAEVANCTFLPKSRQPAGDGGNSWRARKDSDLPPQGRKNRVEALVTLL
jgi:hypothetical protein